MLELWTPDGQTKAALRQHVATRTARNDTHDTHDIRTRKNKNKRAILDDASDTEGRSKSTAFKKLTSEYHADAFWEL